MEDISASLHTKQKRKILPVAFIVLFCLVGLILVSGRFSEELKPHDVQQIKSSGAETGAKINFISPVFYYQPIIKGVLESAPASSPLVEIESFPRIQACISGKGKCKCYTQQLIEYPTTLEQCLTNINRDITSFDPSLKDKKEKQKHIISPGV